MEDESNKAVTVPENAVQLKDMHTSLLSSITERLAAIASEDANSERCTIFRVPAHIRDANRDLYEPRIVSIGPHHRRSHRLCAMEERKWRCLHRLLSHSTANGGLEGYVSKAKELEAQARKCYAESIAISSDEFAEMLLLDSCLVIVLLLEWHSKASGHISEVSWIRELVRSDLILMENQIPFFVLQAFFDLSISHTAISLTHLAIKFILHDTGQCPIAVPAHEVFHLLHLCHYCFIVAPSQAKCLPRSSCFRSCLGSSRSSPKFRCVKMLPSATYLHDAGVAFKRKVSSSFLDVTFRNGTIEIPQLCIEDSSRPHLVNLIAFEQCFPRCGKRLTSYAVFMNCLVSTPRDVLNLQQRGIIENRLASNKEAVQFFNQLCSCAYVDYEDHCLMGLFQDVRDYSESHWPKWRARLVQEYFSSPWAILSIAAALILLGLAIIQTFFSVVSYLHPAT